MDYTAIIVAVIGSNFLVEIIKAIKGAITDRDETVKTDVFNPVRDAIFVMLQDRLEHLLNKALENGYTTKIEIKKLRGFLTVYENLDGDDYIHDLWEMYKELPLK